MKFFNFILIFAFFYFLNTFSKNLYAQNMSIKPAFEKYRSEENPYYWANRKPYEGYWQQDVHYEISARLDDSTEIIHGEQYTLTYVNNSPHDLSELYFHLYSNAFQPGSYYHGLWVENGKNPSYGVYENQGLGTVCEDIKVNGIAVETQLDNTILKVVLPEKLKPGESLIVTMNFKTYFDHGDMRRRMKSYESYGVKHFNGVHWYPILAVYDQKMGWNTNQHLDKEFYANFGVFDIALTLPHEYILDATGVLMNEEEVLPNELKKKLDLKNFADKPFGEKPSIIIDPVDGKTKTWKFRAENVHNFAWTADPTYRIGEAFAGDVRVISLVQEPHASKWQLSADFTAAVVRVYAEDFGAYAWPKVIIADARDGMEYPMLTLDGGTYPGHQGLLAHEVGHMWFYGMVGTNEQYRASLDEGFTQFLTAWSMERLKKESGTQIPFRYSDRYLRLYYPYLSTVNDGYDMPLNTHSSDFRSAIRQGGGYGLVYFKMGTMLYNLRYVLGDELFGEAMRHYFDKWKFCHPYFDDFRQSIIEYTQTDLNWFFDQWLETTKQLDYGISKVRKGQQPNSYQITFERHGEMQMPITFRVTDEDGIESDFYIPNTWFEKETSAQKLPKWYGFGKIQPRYTAEIELSSPIKTVRIDPDFEMADVDRRNNQWRTPKKLDFALTDWEAPFPDWTRTYREISPFVWYNWYDGVQIGAKYRCQYFLGEEHLKAGLWFNSGLLQGAIPEEFANDYQPLGGKIDLRKRVLQRLIPFEAKAFGDFGLRYNAGILRNDIGLSLDIRKQDDANPNHTLLRLSHKVLWSPDEASATLYPVRQYFANRSTERINTSFNLSAIRFYEKGSQSGSVELALRTPGIAAEHGFSRIQLTWQDRWDLGKISLHTRFFGQKGFLSGGADRIPTESLLNLAGANQEELLDHPLTEAAGTLPISWTRTQNPTAVFDGPTGLSNLHVGGGLNLRGFSGFDRVGLFQTDAGNLPDGYYLHQGLSGASLSTEIHFGDFFRWRKPPPFDGLFRFDFYAFADMGAITNGGYEGVGYRVEPDDSITSFPIRQREAFEELLLNAGLGTTLDIGGEFTLRLDLPLYLSTDEADGDFFALRYLVGIGRAF